jgi:endonuclease YncB( thermonuclease family)
VATCPAIALLTFGMICTVQVDRVVDGDTFKADFGQSTFSVRVVGINTPERTESGFAEATKAAKDYFEGANVTLKIGGAKARRDGNCVGQAVMDKYGRVLAAVDGWPSVVKSWDKGPWCR